MSPPFSRTFARRESMPMQPPDSARQAGAALQYPYGTVFSPPLMASVYVYGCTQAVLHQPSLPVLAKSSPATLSTVLSTSVADEPLPAPKRNAATDTALRATTIRAFVRARRLEPSDWAASFGALRSRAP